MPHCFLNSLRNGANEEDILFKSCRVHSNKNEVLKPQEEIQDRDINHSPTDWSNVNSLPIVIRWMLQKIPDVEPTEKNVEPKDESPPLSDESDNETTVPDPMGGEFSQLLSVLSRADMICGGGSGPYFLKTEETSRSNLRAHQKSKGHQWDWYCNLCRKPFSSYISLLHHLQTPCI